jgi:hypothetical protein
MADVAKEVLPLSKSADFHDELSSVRAAAGHLMDEEESGVYDAGARTAAPDLYHPINYAKVSSRAARAVCVCVCVCRRGRVGGVWPWGRHQHRRSCITQSSSKTNTSSNKLFRH